MSNTNPRITGLLGIVHRVADDWRILVVDTAGSRPRVRATEIVPASSPDRVRQVLEAARAEHVLQVVPASASVCRTCTLPDADEQSLEAALRLQAETWLLAGTPEHRYGGGVLPKAEAETSRTGLIASWPESATVDVAPTPVEARWVPAPVALAALLHDERPAEILLSADRARGSVALVICDPGGVSIRSTHVDLEGDWKPALHRVIVETALGGDHTPAFARRAAEEVTGALGPLGDHEAGCRLPESVIASARRRLDDAGGDAAWWSTWGVAAGAALAALGDFADAAALERETTIEEASLVDRLAAGAANPRVAAVVAVGCVVLLGALPLITSGVRLALLQSRHGDVQALADQVTQATARMAMYDALEQRSWPMTKLLGDIASSTPEGITLTNLTVSLDQETFSARGEALGRDGQDAPSRVLLMQRQLGETDGIFSSVNFKWDYVNNFGAYGFTMNAEISRPYTQPEYPIDRDFGTWSAWMRQRNMPPPDPAAEGSGDGDGEGGGAPEGTLAAAETPATGSTPVTRPTTTPRRPTTTDPNRGAERSGIERGGEAPTIGEIPRAERPESRPTSPDRAPRDRIGSSAGETEAGSVAARTGDAGGGGDVPEPLTQAQIDTFDRPQALDYARRVSAAIKRYRGVDGQEELQERLSNEFKLLMARLREIGNEGSAQ